MKINLAIVLTVFLLTNICKAQNTAKPKFNVLSIELGKTGLIYNLNYDHQFREKKLGVRLTAGSNLAEYLQLINVGGGVYYLHGKNKHFFETGADLQYMKVDEVSDDQRGFTSIYPDYSIETFYASFNLGYRLYGKSTLFRVGLSPGFITNEFLPGAYISYGFRF